MNFFLLCILCNSCNNIPDCTLDSEPNTVIVQFFNSADSTIKSFRVDSIKAIKTDSIFFQDTTLSTYNLALNPASDEVTFLFYANPNVDTLPLTYSRNVSVLSEQCGPTIGYSNIEVLDHSFDSVSVINDFLNRLFTKNIEVYD